ncbi:unnamed protein product [Cuscuta campestris]|uniref:Chromo domain-containing protein n=1 Tax=Cuscuta campestris TaxID=132261 RepID=A0A484KTE3_9ASTE|nr:unnamed protein product [Cuscuta campestris]
MTDASSTTADLEAKVGEMGHAVHQMQRDFDFRLTRIDAALAAMQTNMAALQVGGGGRVGRHGDNHEGPRNGGAPTPKPKLEPPKSDGSEPLRWLYQVKEYFSYYETPPEERLRCVTMMLEGPAADWFRWRRNNGLIDGWEDFVEKFKLRFDPLHYVDYLGQLARVRQVGGVMDYQAAFERVLTHVTDVPEQHLQSLFHAGLKNHLQHEISLLKPTTLSDSFALARELEAKHNAIVQSVGSRSGPPAVSTNSRESTASTPIRLLSRAEKMEKDAKGLCYNCDKKWSRDHKCGRFVLMMGEEEGDDEEPDMEEEVDVTADISSLHSMAGVTTPRSLRPTGRISGQSIGVLIDGGSIHNFVHPQIVERLGIPVEVISSFRVYVGNGDSLQCDRQCKSVEVMLQGVMFTVDLYVLQIHGHDVVLGVQWLRQLGQVAHDYEKYLLGREFLIRTDHKSLRELLQQVIQTPDQHFYIRKLLGFRFRIEYKTGASNRVADALSRIHDTSEEVHTLLTISVPVSSLMAELQQENQVQEDLVKRHREHQQGELAEPYSVVDGLLYHRRRLCVSSTSPLRVQLIKEHHDTVMAGHPGVQQTFLRLAQNFFWPKMRAEVREYVGRPQPLPDEFLQGQPVSKPVRVHASRQILRQGKLVQQYLVEWSDGTREDATWEPSEVVRHFYPDVHLEDKVFSQDGGSDTVQHEDGEGSDGRAEDDHEAEVTGTMGEEPGTSGARCRRDRKVPAWHKDYLLH